MIASEEWLTPTRATGIVAYGVAMVCCGLAWARTRRLRAPSQLAALLTAIEGALVLDMVFNWRWMIHQQLMDFAKRRNEYEIRRSPQLIAIAMLAVLLLVGLFAALRILRGRAGALLAVSGVLLSLVLWCTEVISLHAVDHVLYHPLGPWMIVCLVWVFAGLMTSAGILLDARQASGGARENSTWQKPVSPQNPPSSYRN
jgi:hypothetical protein